MGNQCWELRTAVEEGIDSYLKLLERLVRAGRRLQSSLAIYQENRRVTRYVPIEIRNFLSKREKDNLPVAVPQISVAHRRALVR